MKRLCLLPVAAAFALAFALCPSASHAQTAPKYEVDASWPKDLPEGWITGQLGGVCMGAKDSGGEDSVYVVNRRNITDEEKETSISAPSPVPSSTEAMIASGSSLRGLSEVTTT